MCNGLLKCLLCCVPCFGGGSSSRESVLALFKFIVSSILANEISSKGECSDMQMAFNRQSVHH